MRDTTRRLPSFIVIGAMKSGTTSMHAYLAAHPQVFMSEIKEPHFFDWEWERGVDWYHALFDDAGSALALGEASATYTNASNTALIAERMRGVIPDARFVYLLRDPVERIRSHYAFRVLYFDERRPIDQALREDDRYLITSRYADHLEAFLKSYPRDRFLLLTSEELRHDRAAAMRRAFAFIGVDPDAPIEDLETEHFQTRKVRKPRPWARRALAIAHRTPIHFLPGSWNLRLYRSMWQPIRSSASVLDADLEGWLWDQLTPQVQRLRDLTDEPLTLWEPPG